MKNGSPGWDSLVRFSAWITEWCGLWPGWLAAGAKRFSPLSDWPSAYLAPLYIKPRPEDLSCSQLPSSQRALDIIKYAFFVLFNAMINVLEYVGNVSILSPGIPESIKTLIPVLGFWNQNIISKSTDSSNMSHCWALNFEVWLTIVFLISRSDSRLSLLYRICPESRHHKKLFSYSVLGSVPCIISVWQ